MSRIGFSSDWDEPYIKPTKAERKQDKLIDKELKMELFGGLIDEIVSWQHGWDLQYKMNGNRNEPQNTEEFIEGLMKNYKLSDKRNGKRE